MKIVIAPDSFKDSMTALEACDAIKEGMCRVLPENNQNSYHLVPVADGGEGTMTAIAHNQGGRFHHINVQGPLQQTTEAKLLELDDNCYIEVASACGLELVPQAERNPMLTSSFGVGQLIIAALKYQPKKIIIGLGGSATNDGGTGMLAALGARFYRSDNSVFVPTGGTLSEIAKIDLSQLAPELSQSDISFIADVCLPLCGEHGATYTFARQKGASEQQLTLLEQGLTHFADMLAKLSGQHIHHQAGAGAAGGMAIAFMALFNSKVLPGSEMVLKLINFEQVLTQADLVITGEGQVNEQSQYGKAPIGVAKQAKQHNIPVILLTGALSDGYETVYQHGIDAIYSATPAALPLTTALEQAPQNLANLAENIARLLIVKKTY